MRDSYITEMLLLITAGIAGVIITQFGWVGFIIGTLIFALDSYFISTKLKEQTIREYCDAQTYKNERNKTS